MPENNKNIAELMERILATMDDQQADLQIVLDVIILFKQQRINEARAFTMIVERLAERHNHKRMARN